MRTTSAPSGSPHSSRRSPRARADRRRSRPAAAAASATPPRPGTATDRCSTSYARRHLAVVRRHGRRRTPACRPTTSAATSTPASRSGVHLADQHRRLHVEHRRRPRHRPDRPARGARAGCAQTIDTVAGLEKHEPSGMFYNWYDPATRREADAPGPRTATRSTRSSPASTTAGWPPALLVAAAPSRRCARGGRRDPRRRWTSATTTTRPRASGRPGDPVGGQIRGGFWVEDPPDPAAVGPGQLLRHGRRRLVHLPPLRRLQHRAADGVLPRHRRRPDPGQSTTSAPCAPSRRHCDWSWTETKPTGEWRTSTLGIDVFEGALPYRGMKVVPTWGGSMFEALMVPLFVPEETWGPRSWGVNHPLYVQGADRARHGRGRLRLLGLLARPTTPPAATASTASTRSAWTGRATPPTRSGPTGTSPTRAARRPGRRARADGVRRRRGHPARVVPRAALRARGRAGQPREPRARTSTPTARAASTTRSRSRSGTVSQALPLARPGHGHGRAGQRAGR